MHFPSDYLPIIWIRGHESRNSSLTKNMVNNQGGGKLKLQNAVGVLARHISISGFNHECVLWLYHFKACEGVVAHGR
jgi:hypothetical protein